ncbi:hypothetical protein M3Y98_00963200 [Aphelenchoides besseyi]|nr:hypothetical protein M3Y98_00963200 [Aphelenchoides besseyi]KAI6194702.1 hypothetical protein M3Y96_01152700 [Aphelenchoides besseyi]
MPTTSQISGTTSITSLAIVFDENDRNFRVFGLGHCRPIALIAGIFGLLTVCITFSFFITTFTWSKYEEPIEILSLIGFCVFLVSGTFVHICVFLAVKHYNIAFVNPPLIFYCFLVLIELVMALTAVGELVTDSEPQLDESDVLARKILISVPFLLVFNGFMLHVVLKFRRYLRRRLMATVGSLSIVTPVLFTDPLSVDSLPQLKPIA